MNIGVMVCSRTGHTLSVAVQLKEKWAAAGHAVTLVELEPVGPVSPSATRVELKTRPSVASYDAVVFAALVQGGVPAPPMRGYLEQIPSLAGKRVALLVTGFFPAQWGRNQAMAQMSDICAAKGATICGSGSVGWFSLNRRQQIAQAVDSLDRAMFA